MGCQGSSQIEFRLTDHDNEVFTVAFSPDGTKLASGSRDRTVILWDAKRGKQHNELDHPEAVLSVAFSSDGKLLASACDFSGIIFWKPGHRLQVLKGAQRDVLSTAFFGTLLASSSSDGSVILWDSLAGKQLKKLETESNAKVKSLAFSPDGRMLACASSDYVFIWDAPTYIRPFHRKPGNTPVNSLQFSPDATKLACSTGYAVFIWDANTKQELQRIEYGAIEVAFSPDSTIVATASGDKTVSLWDIDTGCRMQQLEGHKGRVYTVAFSPDGTRIASGGADRTVIVWKSNLPPQIRPSLAEIDPYPKAETKKSSMLNKKASEAGSAVKTRTSTSGAKPTAAGLLNQCKADSSTASPSPKKSKSESRPGRRSRHEIDDDLQKYIPIQDFTKNFTPEKTCGGYLNTDVKKYLDSSVPLLSDIIHQAGNTTQSILDRDSSELEPSQLFAIVCYTFDISLLGECNRPQENFYCQLNKVLQTRDPTKIEHFRGYLFFLMGGLNVLPSYRGVVYRGLDASGLTVVDKFYKKTVKIHWSGLSSTSEDFEFARQMAGPDGVVLKIEVHTDAKSISKFSVLPKEHEVLLLPNFSAMVLTDAYIDSASGMKMYDLAEVNKEHKNHTF